MTDKELFTVFHLQIWDEDRFWRTAVISHDSSDVETSSSGKNTDIIISEPQPYLILCGCIQQENFTLLVTGNGIKDLNAPEMINASQAFIVPGNEV